MTKIPDIHLAQDLQVLLIQVDGNGNQLPAGYYTIMSNGFINGESQALGSQVYGKVQSVVLGSGSSGTTLNVEGLGSVTLGEVLEVAS